MGTDLIAHNPLLKKPLLEILTICTDNPDADRDEVEDLAEDAWKDNYRQSPSVCIDILVRNEALEESIEVDGKAYEGTFADIQLDESIDDDADVSDRLTITDVGTDMLLDYAPEETISQLFDEHPEFSDVYYAAIRACDTSSGITRSQIEEAINSFSQLQPDPQTKQTSVYAQYFIDALECAGAIEWDGTWRATDAGHAALANE